MKVLVCGGRDFDNASWLFRTLDCYHAKYTFTQLIHGGATGADFLASLWAVENQVKARAFEANWALYGQRAGPLRNTKMLVEGKPDLVIAFPGGAGTADMVKKAKTAKVEVLEIRP
jgi:hypothetical protein